MLKNKMLSISTLIVFVLSVILTVPALADSGTTPPTTPSSGGRSSNKGSPFSQVPSGTKIVVVDASGNKLPLGSQAAQDIVNNGDPIWCPSSVGSPLAGVSGCSPALYNTNLSTLTNAVETGTWVPTNTNSTVWIEQGPDSSTSSSYLNGGVLVALSNFTLTLAGGWTGTGHNVNTSNPSVLDGGGTNNVVIGILSWNNTVTLSNITVQNGTGNGLHLFGMTKNIVLTNINASNNSNYGAYLDDSTGTGVTITNSTFSYNDQSNSGDYGLYVLSKGPVKLTDTNVNWNYQNGAYIDTADFGTAPVTLTGTNIFDSNGNSSGYGLYVVSDGAITSGSLDANRNSGHGVLLDNCFYYSSVCHNSAIQPVTLTGTSSFSDNTGGDGLDIYSNGTISVNNVTADFNSGGMGAYLWNAVTSTKPSAIKVTGTNWFNNNYYTGLFTSSYGAMSLNNINANYNGLLPGDHGLYANNQAASTPQAITLTGTNTMNYNGGDGAELLGTGAITVNNITAACNGYSLGNCLSVASGGKGLSINNDGFGSTKPQAVTLLGINNISLNNGDDLDVATYGAIKINNLTANSSATGYGAELYFSGAPGAVTLTGINTFDFNYSDGLDVYSNGAISVSNLSAVGNTHSGGAYLVNTAGMAGVTLTGVNTFDSNYGNGLSVYSNGAISVSNLSAVGSTSSDGVHLVNTAGLAGVTLTGVNTFDSNHDYGLYINTNGAINASNLTALLNGSTGGAYGVYLYNGGGTAGVTLTGTNTFDSNYSEGLEIDSNGAITTNNLTASFNGTGFSGADGVYIFNSGASTPKTVTLNGINTFDNNNADGLYVSSKGTITTNNITANYNTGYGAELINNGSGTGSISVKGTNVFLGNADGNGLVLYSNSTASVTHITADNNSGDGLYANTSGKVTLTCGSFMVNGDFGWITGPSVPSITLIGVDNAGNHSGGSQYYNFDGTSVITTPRTCTLP